MTGAARSELPDPNSTPSFFRAEGLQKRFGGVKAVDNISLAIPSGVVFAIIGPNGAGKSTFLI